MPFKTDQKSAGAFLVGLMDHPAFMRLRAKELGCLVMWGGHLLKSGVTSTQIQELRQMSSHFASLGANEFEQMLNELACIGLIATDGAEVTLPLVSSALDRRLGEVIRRKEGWSKRKNPSHAPKPAADPMKPLKRIRGSAPDLKGELLGGIRKPSLFGADANDDTPVAVRVLSKTGELAEFTEGFMEAMKPLYPGVDVHGEMLRAAEWCRGKPERRKTLRGVRSFITGWLSRAHQRRDITFAVVAASNQRNGFGRGGSHGHSSGAPQQSGASLFDLEEAYADILKA